MRLWKSDDRPAYHLAFVRRSLEAVPEEMHLRLPLLGLPEHTASPGSRSSRRRPEGRARAGWGAGRDKQRLARYDAGVIVGPCLGMVEDAGADAAIIGPCLGAPLDAGTDAAIIGPCLSAPAEDAGTDAAPTPCLDFAPEDAVPTPCRRPA